MATLWSGMGCQALKGFEHVYVKEHFIDWALEQQIGLHCLE